MHGLPPPSCYPCWQQLNFCVGPGQNRAKDWALASNRCYCAASLAAEFCVGPGQNRAEDWALGSNGCYDAASLARLQMTLKLDFESVADGNLTGCLSRPIRPDVLAALKAETMRADPVSLGNIMADHTQVTSDLLPAPMTLLKCDAGMSVS